MFPELPAFVDKTFVTDKIQVIKRSAAFHSMRGKPFLFGTFDQVLAVFWRYVCIKEAFRFFKAVQADTRKLLLPGKGAEILPLWF